MRIVLIDRPGSDDRPAGRNRFLDVVELLEAHGHEVLLLDGAPPPEAGKPPILTGLNRATATAPMMEAHAVAHHIVDLQADLVIAPLRGGIAQGLLMARACGEAFGGTRVALWCDTPSGARFLRDDDVWSGLAPLIADALERQAFALADALIMPEGTSADLFAALGKRAVPSFRTRLPLPSDAASDAPPSHPRDIAEIVFAGPMTRRAGLVDFIEAIMRLSKAGLLGDRTVTFLGPVRPSAQGIGRDWFGLRAASWPFAFKVLDLADHDQRTRYVSAPGRLAVAIADDPDEHISVRRGGPHHIALLRASESREKLPDRIEVALRRALEDGPSAGSLEHPELDWPALVSKIAGLPAAGPLQPSPLGAGVTVCVLHHNRLAHLADAIASIPDEVDGHPVEILVLDNASDVPFVEEEIRKLAGRRSLLRIVRFEEPVYQPFALNRGLVESRFETVLFLDDDNNFASGGVQRLARAVAAGGLDIVVSSLDVFDDGAPTPPPSVGRLIFLGAAHSAGLFFNAFGDTAMAVRREAFLRLGGFHEPGYSYPCLDWVTLAKAHAAGLRIGALQWPAVRYRRDTARADAAANKLDQEGARSLVFEAYGDRFDAALLARYAQKLQLEEV